MNYGFELGFKKVGMDYHFSFEDVWHLRGIEEFDNGYKCIEALYCIIKIGANLCRILEFMDPAEELRKLKKKAKIGSEDKSRISLINRIYKEYFYSEKARSQVKLINGTREALKILIEKKKDLYIFTNTSRDSCIQDLESIDVNIFRDIVGAEDGTCEKKPSGQGIKYLIDKHNLDPNETVYVGDSSVDIIASRNAGVKCAIVLSGMGLKNHLEKGEPDLIFKNVLELANSTE